jgi:hypothetical protein
VVTWILREAYFNGETFTMGGKEMRLEKVVCPEDLESVDEDEQGHDQSDFKSDNHAKVIALADLKKK